jgi:hypothetical protein
MDAQGNGPRALVAHSRSLGTIRLDASGGEDQDAQKLLSSMKDMWVLVVRLLCRSVWPGDVGRRWL